MNLLTKKETLAVMSAGTATVIPTVGERVGMDNLIIDLADAVFEGDVGSAKAVSGTLFTLVGIIMLYAGLATVTSAKLEALLIGGGVAFIALALQSSTVTA